MPTMYLGSVLLTLLVGVSQADLTDQSCPAPSVKDGYIVPKKGTFNHKENLTYSCNSGYKPAVEGWWAQITCENGDWSENPQCIDQKSCLPPTVPNGKYQVNLNGWYQDGSSIDITCLDGYTMDSDQSPRIECKNEDWSTFPVCQKSRYACGEPPKIPNTVIIDQEYQEVFAEFTELKFECEDGYATEKAQSKTFMVCASGQWEGGPVCKIKEPSSSVTPAPPATGRGNRPSLGDSSDVKADGGDITSAVMIAAGAETASSFGSHGITQPLTTRVSVCDPDPIIINGVLMEKSEMFLKYKCNNFYTLVGPDTVRCHSNGTWSTLPVCKESFCVLDPAQEELSNLNLSGRTYMTDNEEKAYACKTTGYTAVVRCMNRSVTISACCTLWYGQLYCI